MTATTTTVERRAAAMRTSALTACVLVSVVVACVPPPVDAVRTFFNCQVGQSVAQPARSRNNNNTHTHTRSFNGHFSGTTRVSRYQKGKTNLDFTGARDSEWQWHQLGHMQVCTSLQTDNHASTPPLSFFYRPDALPATQPTASKH